MNRAAVFAYLRQRDSGVFGTSLTQGQVDGVEAILDATQGLPLAQRAYILATAYHETDKTMQPIREARGKSDAQTIRRMDKAWADGKLPWVKRPYWRKDKDGKAWFGRGYVQITHKDNYRRVGAAIKTDLITDPGAALLPHVAVRVLVVGMVRGLFTGKTLDDYIGPSEWDFVGARRIVNGTDRAEKIAGYAEAFRRALVAGREKTVPASTKTEKAIPDSPDRSIWAILAAIIAAIRRFLSKTS